MSAPFYENLAFEIFASAAVRRTHSTRKNPMKTKEELNELKIEYESLSRKLAELTDEELEQVSGGSEPNPTQIDVYDCLPR